MSDSKAVAPANITHTSEQIVALLKKMRLRSMVEPYLSCIADSAFADLPFNEQLWLLLKETDNIRRANKYELLRRQSRMGAVLPLSNVESVIKANGITPTKLAMLTSMEFINKPNSHLILCGGSNSHKTEIGRALLDTAMRQCLTARYANYDMFIGHLRDKYDQRGEYDQALEAAIKPYRLIMLDDVFLNEKQAHEVAILKDILDRCNVWHTGLILSTQKDLEQWRIRLGSGDDGLVVMRRIMDSPYILRLKSMPLKGHDPVLITGTTPHDDQPTDQEAQS